MNEKTRAYLDDLEEVHYELKKVHYSLIFLLFIVPVLVFSGVIYMTYGKVEDFFLISFSMTSMLFFVMIGVSKTLGLLDEHKDLKTRYIRLETLIHKSIGG